jgi:hypothetical protein
MELASLSEATVDVLDYATSAMLIVMAPRLRSPQ